MIMPAAMHEADGIWDGNNHSYTIGCVWQLLQPNWIVPSCFKFTKCV